MASKFFYSAAMAVLLMFSVSGCSLLEVVEDSPMASYIVVQQSTLRFIGDDVERAERVIEIAEQVEEYAAGTVTVALLIDYTRAQVRWDKMSLADAALLDSLLMQLSISLEDKMGTGELSPEDLINVQTVVEWIKQNAQFAVENIR